MKLAFVPLETATASAWDDFCARSDEAWFWHSRPWLDYCLAYRPDLSPQPRAFLAVEENRVVGICPLMLETFPDGPGGVAREFSLIGDACLAPALANELGPARERVLGAMLDEVDRLAADDGVRRVTFRRTALAPSFESTSAEYEALVRYGYLETPLATQVIFLSDGEEGLLREMRKGHRADVTRGLRLLDVQAITSEAFDAAAFEAYVALHRKAASRVTRDRRTFDLMEKWIQEGYAALFLAKLNHQPVGAAYIFVAKGAAYYGSAANDPDYPKLPIGHILQWRILQWLKRSGVERYELGLQAFGPLPHQDYSAKEVAISSFKRGFGGKTLRLPKVEKYYDSEFYVEEQAARAARYAAHISIVCDRDYCGAAVEA